MRVPLASALTFVVCFLVLPGCDSEDPSEPGSFEVTVEGAASASFSGAPVALVYTTSTSNLSETTYTFQLAMRRTRQIVSITALPADGRTLAAGAYSFGMFESEDGPLAFGVVDVGAGGFVSRTGTLTLTRLAPERVRGEFEFEADDESGDRTVTVRGRFETDLPEAVPVSR